MRRRREAELARQCKYGCQRAVNHSTTSLERVDERKMFQKVMMMMMMMMMHDA